MKLIFFLSIIIENVAHNGYTYLILMARFLAKISQYDLFLFEKLRCGTPLARCNNQSCCRFHLQQL